MSGEWPGKDTGKQEKEMKEKFTPGPWKIVDHDGYGVNVWNVAGNKCIAERCRSDDARLIAAAPDMYDALKAFKAYMVGPRDLQALLIMVDAALAKADGIA